MSLHHTLGQGIVKAPFIVHVSTSASWRGGEQQALYLIEELAERGENQVLISARDGVLASKASGLCEVVTVPHGNIHMLRWARSIVRLSCSYAHPIVHAHDAHAHSYAVLASSLLTNPAPIVVSRRVQVPVQSSQASRWKYNHPSVAAIVCVSEYVKAVTSSAIANKAVLHTVYDGIRLERFTPTSNSKLRTQLAINTDQPIVGYVAALTKAKDHGTFIRTAAILHAQNPRAVFVIIGEGSERSTIESAIAYHKLSNVVHVLGYRNDVNELLPEMDLFLFTSASEGLGSSVLDAMASGLPVIATSAGGIPELIQSGYNGLLAPVGDANGLAEHGMTLLTNAEQRSLIVRNATETVKGFSISVMTTTMLQLYRSIINTSVS